MCVHVHILAHCSRHVEVKGQIAGQIEESGLSFYIEGTKLRTLGFGILMLLPAEPFHPCRLQNFKSLFFCFLSRNTLGMMVQTYNPSTQEALKCGANLGCVVNSGLSGTTVRLPEKTNKQTPHRENT